MLHYPRRMPMLDAAIAQGVTWIGVNDRTTDLFEGLWPIQDVGVTYNSYLVAAQKKAIIDLSKAIKTDEYLGQIARMVKLSEIDYLILNHMEPDHTGVLRTLRSIAPRATILGTPKLVAMLESWYGITEGVRAVGDGETLELGGRTLRFFHAPFVHWPETMVTYDPADGILFSCDAFGGYGALRGAIFDDQCRDKDFYIREALRYYATIVAKFSPNVLRAIEKLAALDVRIIAPSHGLVWRKDPGRIIELYRRWAGYAAGEREKGATLVYGSMYGSTEKMMNAVAQGISSTGVELEIFDVARTHPAYILPSLWTRQGVMIGAPTYETNLFPPMQYLLHLCALKRIHGRRYAIYGSCGWSGGAFKHAAAAVEPLQWTLHDSFQFVGSPTDEDLRRGEEFGSAFGRSIRGQA
jgi:anaerobic nitric oxide reductase flavorubredoxin